MTEQQIEQLKEILDSAELDANSAELDNKILRAAASRIQKAKPTGFTATWQRFVRSKPFGVAGAALASLILTISVLFGLSRMLERDERVVQKTEKPSIVIDFDKTDSSQLQEVAKLSRPDDSIIYPGDLSISREFALAELVIPPTDLLLSSFNYALPKDRNAAQAAITVAMNDIRSMINQGRVDSARHRYTELVRNCEICILPNSLDLLVARSESNAGSG
jgi:hypothetical protein